MGQMTDHAKQTIVRAWIHDLYFGADFFPERRDFFQRLPIGPTGRRENTTMAHEEIAASRLSTPLLATRDRMAGNEINVFGQETLHAAHDLAFHAAHVADDAPRLELWKKGFGERNDRFHRRAHHQEIDAGRKFFAA